MQWTMITLCYVRIPAMELYTGNLTKTLVEQQEETLLETLQEKVDLEGTPLEEFIRQAHRMAMGTKGSLKITMIRPLPMSPWSDKTEKAYELSLEETQTIRNDLPEALRRFAPVHRTVGRPTKETDNAKH